MIAAPSPSSITSATVPGQLRRRSLWLMLALTVVTFQLYPIYWVIDTTRSLNYHVEQKISTGFMVACSVLLVPAQVAFLISRWLGLGQSWLLLIAVPMTLWVLWSLRVRAQFNEYVRHRQGDWLKASLLWTVLLQPYYLQFKINEAIEAGLFSQVPASPVRSS